MKMPKLWYTVKEAAQELDCTEDDVLHLIQTHQVYPSFLLKESDFRVMRLPPDHGAEDENGQLLDPEGYGKFYDDFWKNAPLEQYSGLFSPIAFSADDAGLLLKGREWRGNLRNGGPLVDGKPSFLYKEKVLFYLAETVPITADDFLIVTEEIERLKMFCKDHFTEPETESFGADGIVFDIPSQTELARMCGVTTRTIPNWEAKGLFSEGHGREKWYSRIATAEWLKQTGKYKELELFNKSK